MTDDWMSLTNALTQAMRTHAPGWTDGNDSDPGITMLELIAPSTLRQPWAMSRRRAASKKAAASC